MSARCDHGVSSARYCSTCFELGTRFWEEVERRQRRLADMRALLHTLLPAPSVVQDLCCRLYRARHASPPEVTRDADHDLGALLKLLVEPADLDHVVEVLADEIERAERRGYVRGGADTRARATCQITNQPRSALGPGEARCDDDERESEPDEQRRVAVTRRRGGARAPRGGEEGAIDEAG